MAVTVTKQINANNITFTLSGSGSVALNTANTYSDRDLILKILSEEGGENVFDENGNLNVPGDIIVGGHSSPIGTRLTGTIANTQATSTATTKHTIDLPEGIWILTVNVCFGTKTTTSGSTSTAAGSRAVILSTSDASYTGAQVASSSYAGAGASARVQATYHAYAGSDGATIKVRLYSQNNCATTLGYWVATRIA